VGHQAQEVQEEGQEEAQEEDQGDRHPDQEGPVCQEAVAEDRRVDPQDRPDHKDRQDPPDSKTSIAPCLCHTPTTLPDLTATGQYSHLPRLLRKPRPRRQLQR
jgi:hypothetical protein